MSRGVPVRVLAIAGGTASGKTTVAQEVARTLGALLVTHDRYYRSGDASTNYDHPDSLDTGRLVEDLDALRSGRGVVLPRYDFARHAREEDGDAVTPAPWIVVEGILVLSDARLRERFDISVFVDAPADVRLVRRVRRDAVARGRACEDVFRQYLATVRPMHEAFVVPTMAFADAVIDGMCAVEESVARVLEVCRRSL